LLAEYGCGRKRVSIIKKEIELANMGKRARYFTQKGKKKGLYREPQKGRPCFTGGKRIKGIHQLWVRKKKNLNLQLK